MLPPANGTNGPDSPESIESPGAEFRPDDPQIERVGPYRPLEVLGEGGMGVVYLAEQSEPVRRQVALKIIKPGMDTKQVVARFDAERQALAVMDHPNIAKVYDGGATETGRPYFVMELARGVPITEYCDMHKLSVRERLELFIPVCHAVQHAHQKGVIHRDLKPSNILITIQDGKEPVPKVIDFGIAKAMGQRLTELTLHTQRGEAVGTPAYMSPEQAEMSGLDVDTRTDIYSLGVILYELLAGNLPYDPRDLAGLAAIATLRETEPPTPSRRFKTLGDRQEIVAQQRHTDPGSLRRALKGDLDWITMKAMEKDRTRRYETANGLALDVQRYLNNQPVMARAPSTGYRVGKFVQRHKAGTSFAALLLAVLVGFAITMSIQAGRIARERDRAELAAAKASAVNDFMVRTLLSPDPIDQLGPDATVTDALDAAVAKFEGEFSEEPEVDATIRSAIGWAYFKLGRYDDAEPLLMEALRIRTQLLGDKHVDLAESLHQAAAMLEVRTDYDSAEVMYRRALEMRRELREANGRRVAETLQRYGGLLILVGRYDEAEGAFLEALSIQQSLGENEPFVAAAMSQLGNLYWIQGDLEKAESYLRDALKHRQVYLDPDHPLVGESLNNLAVLLDDLEKKDEAEALYRQAIAITENAFGQESEHVGAMLGNLAMLLQSKGEHEEAEELYRRTLSIDRRQLGNDHPAVAIDLVNLGTLLCSNDRASEGTPLLEDAVRIFRSVFDPEQWEIAAARSVYGFCLGELGRFQEGERELLDALEIMETALGPEHTRTQKVRSRLADLYMEWGRPDEAAQYRK